MLCVKDCVSLVKKENLESLFPFPFFNHWLCSLNHEGFWLCKTWICKASLFSHFHAEILSGIAKVYKDWKTFIQYCYGSQLALTRVHSKYLWRNLIGKCKMTDCNFAQRHSKVQWMLKTNLQQQLYSCDIGAGWDLVGFQLRSRPEFCLLVPISKYSEVQAEDACFQKTLLLYCQALPRQ